MAGRPPPPSFSSFPDAASSRQPAAPPSFASFPSPPRDRSPLPPQKRYRSRPGPEDFLDSIGGELGIGSSRQREDRSSESKDRERHAKRHHRSHDGPRDDRNERRDSHKGKDRERDRSHDERHRSRDHDRSERSREKDRDDRHRRDERTSSSKKSSAPRTRERDYGGATEKKYRFVADLAATDPVERPPASAEPASTDRPVYYESKRGDENNLRYGGLHRGDVPRYRRVAGGKVLGLNDGLRITKETAYTNRGMEVAPVNRFRTPRYVDSSSLRHLTDKSTKRIFLRPRTSPRAVGEKADDAELPEVESAAESDFVALPRERTAAEKIDQLEHEEGTDYRSVAGLIKPADLAEASSDEEGDDLFSGAGISGGESHSEYLRRRNVELDRALRDAPNDIDKWLEFVMFQDELAQTGFSETSTSGAKRALSKGERASTSEIKLAILDRALAVPGNADAEPLLLAQLEAAAEIEEPQRVLKRWREALEHHPDLTGLWIAYVSSRQTTWATFTVPDLIAVFEESLGVLSASMEAYGVSAERRELLESNAIYLLLRFCLMLRQAGYTERALATMQAAVEFNLFRPRELAQEEDEAIMPWRERLFEGFEAFWDAEAPRIGEEGAKGWSATGEDALPPDAPVGRMQGVVETLTQVEDGRPYERWATAERAAGDSDRPARTVDPGMDESDDPYRVVLFDDFRPFLFDLESPDSRHQLAYAFLTFIGLPFMPVDVPTSTPFTTDPFIHSELLERPSAIRRYLPSMERIDGRPFSVVAGEPMEREARTDIRSPWDMPFHASPTSVDTLFGAGQPGWFSTVTAEDLEDVDVSFARNVLAQLRSQMKDPFLVLQAFALEAAQSPKSAVKLAKQVLRDRRQDLVLWDGYARIERQRGKIAEARQVYRTALSMYRSFVRQDQIDGPLLWRAWAEMEWEDGRPGVALQVLVAASSEKEADLSSVTAGEEAETRPPRAALLVSRHYYARELEAAFQPDATQAIIRNRNHLAYSLALFEYLTRNLTAAVEVFEQHLFRLDCAGGAGSAEYEEALAMYAKLLQRHMLVGGGYRPAQLRQVLERAIEHFPNDTVFLSLFYHNELRMRIQNHFRRVLEERVLKSDQATSEGWLFAIFAELHLDVARPNLWAVRNLFDRALDDPRTRSAPSLWTLYIDFEVKNGELKRAKALIYRAIRDCPWCKEFYLRPFSPTLRSVYRSRELNDFHHLLLEKGIRVRVDIEPFLAGSVTSDMEVEVGPEMERLEDAGEEVLTERQRLAPY